MTTKYRNYFSGFSFLTGFQYGHFRSKEGERARPQRLVFSGNDSSYTRTLPLVYGRARVADPILLIAKPEGDFLTTLWAVCEGLLATNPADDTQSGSFASPVYSYNQNYAYSATFDATGNRVENIFVNGESRHDPRPGYGIEVANGDQDRAEPASVFFPTDPSDFIVSHLGYWGTARVTFRINTKSNPSVDLNGGQVSGSFEVQFGRVHRVYTNSSTFVLRATDDGITPGANPSFVQMDLLASKRAGAGLDYSRLNIQSFVDLASYCRATVTNVFDGSPVKRWTFNGVIDQTRSLADWLHVVAIGCYSLPPYPDKDGLLKVRALKAEDTSSVPLFSSKVASTTGRNILWENGHSSLVKSRRPITEVPNEIRVNFIDKSYDPQYVATLISNINAVSDPVSFTIQWSAAAIAAGVQFNKDDKIIIDSETLWITLQPSAPNGSHQQTLHCQRAYNGTTKAAHGNPARVQFTGRAYAKISVVVADRDVQDEYGQVLGDQSRQVISKTIDLPGTTTEDEAARIGTLILRAGEFGQGGLANNSRVAFKAFYRDAEDLEIGDIIEVEDDQLNPTDNEIFYRVTRITAGQITQTGGAGIVFVKDIEAVLHDNDIYDDTAFGVSDFTRVNGSGAFDVAPPPVTDFGVAENGIFDANNKPVTTLTFDYTEPSPLENFRSVIIYRSTDDGSGLSSSPPTAGAPVGDWRYIVEVLQSGQTIQYPISGAYEWFCAVSRPISGHTPDIDSKLADGSYEYPRLAVLVDGVTDVLPAPSSPAIQAISGGGIQLTWLPYTGSNLKLYKAFHIYRNTTNSFGSATLVASLDGTFFFDSSPAASTTYYYWVVGFSVLNQEGTPTSVLTTTSATTPTADSGVPDAPTIAIINDEIEGFHLNTYNWLVLINKPGGAANWGSIDHTVLQIATDSGFTAFPSGISFDGTATGGGLYAGAPPRDAIFTTTVPGTYYVRAKVHNSFGDSAWSSTLSRSTNYEDALAADSTIPSAPENLTVTKNLTLTALGGVNTGNAFNVSFTIPKGFQSYYGFSIYIHSSSTLPTATTQYSSFAHGGVSGSLSVGSNVLTVAGSPGFSVNAWAGKDLVIFGTHRGGSPTFDYEGQLFIVNIISNTSSTITFSMPEGLEIYSLTGLGFYVVNNNVGDHFYEKLTLTTPLELDESDLSAAQDLTSTRTALFNSDIPNVYVWVALYNLLGQGKVTASPPTLSFSGTSSTGVARLKIFGKSGNPSFDANPPNTLDDGITRVNNFSDYQAAIDSLGSKPGLVLAPQSYAGPEFSHLPNQIVAVDLRQKEDTLSDGISNIRRPAQILIQNYLGDVTGRNLTGTVTMTNGSTSVTGSGTAFLSEVAAGDTIKLSADSATSWAKVASVTNNTALTLAANYPGTGGSGIAIDGQAQLGLVIKNTVGGSPNTSGAAETVGLTVKSQRASGNRALFAANFNATALNNLAGGAALEIDYNNQSGSDWPDGTNSLNGEDQENFILRIISAGTHKVQGGILMDAATGAEMQRGIVNKAWSSMGIYSVGRTSGPHLYMVPHANSGAANIIGRDSTDAKTVHYLSDTGIGFFTALHMGLDTATGEDINLTRAAAGILQTDSALSFIRTNATDAAVVASKIGDSTSRFFSDCSGLMQWSSGSASSDAGLRRSGGGTLLLSANTKFEVDAPVLEISGGVLNVSRSSSSDYLLVGGVSGDSISRYGVTAAGVTQWSAGSGSVDITMFRAGAHNLQFDSVLSIIRANTTDLIFAGTKTGDTVSRYSIDATGLIQWSSGSGSADCTLRRDSAGILKFDLGAISINGLLVITGTGSPEGIYTAAPGSLFLDTNGGLYVKQAGAGNTGWVLK